MPLLRVLLAAVLAALPLSMAAQGVAPAVPSGSSQTAVSATVGPALSQVAQSLNGINIHRWKAPNPVRDAADEDVTSIQRDLSGTLAGLLQQADAAPGSVPAAFAVYRNVDALYDTLLRVVETAQLAAPDNEESSLDTALKALESARGSLGDAILSGSETQQAELTRLRTAIASAAAAQRVPVRTTVVDDGPVRTSSTAHTTHHRHTAAAGSTSRKATASPAQPPNPTPNSSNPQ